MTCESCGAEMSILDRSEGWIQRGNEGGKETRYRRVYIIRWFCVGQGSSDDCRRVVSTWEWPE